MAGQGHTIGGKFEELRAVIDLVKDKARVGVCLDTCHMFAAGSFPFASCALLFLPGYELRTKEGYEKTMSEFERVVGWRYLKAVHLNDSMSEHSVPLDERIYSALCRGARFACGQT